MSAFNPDDDVQLRRRREQERAEVESELAKIPDFLAIDSAKELISAVADTLEIFAGGTVPLTTKQQLALLCLANAAMKLNSALPRKPE